MKEIQQGDVILIRRDDLTPESILETSVRLGSVIQEGEVTGHAHKLNFEGNTQGVYTKQREVLNNGRLTVALNDIGEKFLILNQPTALTHEEHNKINVPAGVWEVRIVRAFDYDSMESRRVAD